MLFPLPSRTSQNLHVEALCLWKNLCSWKNQKWKKVLEKKKQAQRKKRITLSSKEQNYFMKATGTSGASRWLPEFEQ